MADHGVKFSDSPPKAGAGTIDKGLPSKGESRGNAKAFKPGHVVDWPGIAQGRIHKAI